MLHRPSISHYGCLWCGGFDTPALRSAVLHRTGGGVDFNQDDKPTFADFAYLAFTIAVTYGVTDTTLKNRAIRLSALQQAMVSYLFGTVILAVTIEVIGTQSGL
jgi:uncharacterized membrane protein